MPRFSALLLLLLLASGPALAQLDAKLGEQDAGTVEVEACLRRNLPERSSEQRVRFEATDRMGGSRKLAGRVFWRKGEDGLSKSLIRLEEPPDLRGSAYLLLERADDVDIFVYLPEYQKVRRVTPHTLSGSLFGTDFSYEDMRRLRHLLEHTGSTRLPDTEQGGRRAYALRLAPPEDSGYGQVLAWIDVETCVLLKLELYGRGGALAKVLTTDPATLEKSGALWVAKAFTLRDLEEQTETRLEFGAIEVDGDVPERLFSERALMSGR